MGYCLRIYVLIAIRQLKNPLKALLIYKQVEFPWTHSIAKLLEIIEGTNTYVPEEIKSSVALTDYAVETRYPGDYAPVDEKMYEEALYVAEMVVKWVENLLGIDMIDTSNL